MHLNALRCCCDAIRCMYFAIFAANLSRRIECIIYHNIIVCMLPLLICILTYLCIMYRELNIGFGWANSLMVADISGKNAATVQNAVTVCAMEIRRATR